MKEGNHNNNISKHWDRFKTNSRTFMYSKDYLCITSLRFVDKDDTRIQRKAAGNESNSLHVTHMPRRQECAPKACLFFQTLQRVSVIHQQFQQSLVK